MRLSHTLPALALLFANASCATRTVYVYDDDDRGAPSAAPAAAPDAYAPPEAPRDERVSTVDQFYEPLSPYGRWVYDPTYGDVWVPDAQVVGANYRPYTYGHWAHTEWGWTWVDAHPFGWATGHYGQWYYDRGWGWVWVPGTQWAPAWVTWRHGGGHIGWAPIPPGGYYGRPYTVYDTSWVFVRYDAFGSPYLSTVLVVGPAYHGCFASTVVYRDVYYVHGRPVYRGPDYDTVRRADHRVVHRPIREVDRDRAVLRPPQGTALPRPGSTSRPKPARDAGRAARQDASDDRGTSRDRPRDARDDRGAPRDDDRTDRDGRADRPERGNGDGNDDRGRGNDDQSDHTQDGHGRDGVERERGDTGRDDGRAGAASTGRGSDDIQGRRPSFDARRDAPGRDDVRPMSPGQLGSSEQRREDLRRSMDDRSGPSPGRYGAPPSRSQPARRAPADDGAFQRRDSRPSAPSSDMRGPSRSAPSRPSVQAPPQQAPQQEQQAPAKKKKKDDGKKKKR